MALAGTEGFDASPGDHCGIVSAEFHWGCDELNAELATNGL
jgi:hypothetical protein